MCYKHKEEIKYKKQKISLFSVLKSSLQILCHEQEIWSVFKLITFLAFSKDNFPLKFTEL